MEDLKPRVRAYIRDNFFLGDEAAQEIRDGDSFMENHIIDSTGFLELIAFLEDTFGIRVDDEEMIPENLDSLDKIDAYLKKKLVA